MKSWLNIHLMGSFLLPLYKWIIVIFNRQKSYLIILNIRKEGDTYIIIIKEEHMLRRFLLLRELLQKHLSLLCTTKLFHP